MTIDNITQFLPLVNTVILAGIFYRLGNLRGTVDSHAKLIEALQKKETT